MGTQDPIQINMRLFGLFLLASIEAGGKSLKAVTRESSKSIRNHGLELLFNEVEVNENIVISPMSIIGCMYMLAAGSAGESRAEILEALDFGEYLEGSDQLEKIKKPFEAYKQIVDEFTAERENGHILEIANGMFHQEAMNEYTPAKLNAAFVDLLQSNFITDIANIQEVDFKTRSVQATKQINDWVRKQTHNKMPELFSEPLDNDTLVILASTLYFKASWDKKFKALDKREIIDQNICFASSTQDLLDSNCHENIGWIGKTDNLVYMEYRGPVQATVFELPMQNGGAKNVVINNKFTMQIWVPGEIITDPETDAQFRQFIQDKIKSFRRQAKKNKCKVQMPKFSLEFSKDMVSGLQKMGVNKVFSDAADLSPMLGDDAQASVRKIQHAVKFELDEDGVEGAAVTSAQISSRTFSAPKLITVNKPFYFVVSNRCWESGGRGKTCNFGNVPLFIGRVVNP